MDIFKLQFKESTDRAVQLQLHLNIPVLTYNAKLTIQVKEGQRSYFKKNYYQPFPRMFTLSPLPSSKILLIEGQFINGKEKYESVVHCFTKHAQINEYQSQQQQNLQQIEQWIRRRKRYQRQQKPALLSKSQKMVKQIAKVIPVNKIQNPDRTLLLARKQKGLKNFIEVDKRKHTVLVTNTIQLLEGISSRQGRKFLRNDWFMGPFYSYNGNIK